MKIRGASSLPVPHAPTGEGRHAQPPDPARTKTGDPALFAASMTGKMLLSSLQASFAFPEVRGASPSPRTPCPTGGGGGCGGRGIVVQSKSLSEPERACHWNHPGIGEKKECYRPAWVPRDAISDTSPAAFAMEQSGLWVSHPKQALLIAFTDSSTFSLDTPLPVYFHVGIVFTGLPSVG
jgi:hypothetical protein